MMARTSLFLEAFLLLFITHYVVSDYTTQHHLKGDVVDLLKEQISIELRASTSYLAMASHFGSENINRPGFAKFFKASSEEEFEHAQKFVKYLTKRGIVVDASYFNVETPMKTKWRDGTEALQHALEMEGKVTEKLINIHEKGKHDGHLTNFIESEFLTEQVDSMRELAGYKHNLQAMMDPNAHGRNMLAEYLFDQQFLKKE